MSECVLYASYFNSELRSDQFVWSAGEAGFVQYVACLVTMQACNAVHRTAVTPCTCALTANTKLSHIQLDRCSGKARSSVGQAHPLARLKVLINTYTVP